MDKQLKDRKKQQLAINAFLLLSIILILSASSGLPKKEVVVAEFVTEFIVFVISLVIYYYFVKIRFVAAQFGWALFCLGVALDLVDEFVVFESKFLTNAEEFFSISGLMVVAWGFQKSSAKFSHMLDLYEKKSEHFKDLAHTDKLTGLANRERIITTLNESIQFAKDDSSKLAIVFMDLNKFKPANDKYGHDVGDLLLQAVAARISDITRDKDLVCRWGGDEFIILQAEIKDDSASKNLCARVQSCFDTPFLVHNQEIQLGVSVGYSVFPDDAESAGQLIKRADIAMYQAKSHQTGPVRFNSKLISE